MNDISDLNKYFENKTKISSSSLKKKLFSYKIKEKKCERCELVKWLGLPAPLELHHIDGKPLNNELSNLQILCANCHSLTPNFRANSQRRIVIKKTVEEIVEAIKDSYNPRHALMKLGYHAKGANYQRIYSIQEKYDLEFRPMTEEEKKLEKETRMSGLKKSWGERREKFTKECRIIKEKKPKMTQQEAWIKSRKVLRPSKEELLEMVWKKSVFKIGEELGISDNAIRKWAQIYQIPVPPSGYWAKFYNGYLEECNKIKEDLFSAFNL